MKGGRRRLLGSHLKQRSTVLGKGDLPCVWEGEKLRYQINRRKTAEAASKIKAKCKKTQRVRTEIIGFISEKRRRGYGQNVWDRLWPKFNISPANVARRNNNRKN